MTRLVCLCFPTKTNTQANILLKTKDSNILLQVFKRGKRVTKKNENENGNQVGETQTAKRVVFGHTQDPL